MAVAARNSNRKWATPMNVFFEDCGRWISFKDSAGKVIIRCKTSATDIGYEESLDNFVARHGGVEAAIGYVRECQ